MLYNTQVHIYFKIADLMLRYFGNKDDCYESGFGYHKFHLLQGPTIKKYLFSSEIRNTERKKPKLLRKPSFVKVKRLNCKKYLYNYIHARL